MAKWRRILYHPNLPLGPGGKRVTACKEHIELSKNAAKEGMVLLKNQEGLLPLARGAKIALFGKGSFDYVKGGGGSGDVTVEYTVNLYEGLKKMNGHGDVFEELAEYYHSYVQEQYDAGCLPGQLVEPELPEALCIKARCFTDTAILSISRFSGEGWDRHLKGHEMFENGDFYLSNAERTMVEKVKKHFPRIIVVMNVGGMVDTQWFYNDDSIGAVLMAWQGGMEGGTAAAELMCGYGNPCGKLVDTFAKTLEDYPSTENFHESEDYVDYTEDIYVGYRYFETIPGAAERVNYPFGFGLSYTKFEWTVNQLQHCGDSFILKATVRNVGNYAGREVLQVYVCAPQGKLGKANRSLVAFQKTKVLEPGCDQELTLQWNMAAMASFDDLGKVHPAAYVLERGEYRFYVGTSVRDTVCCEHVFRLDEDRVVEQLNAKVVPSKLKKRMLADGSYEKLPVFETQPTKPDGLTPLTEYDFEHAEAYIRGIDNMQNQGRDESGRHWFGEVVDGTITIDEFVHQLTDEQLCHAVCGQPNVGVANTRGFGNLPDLGVPNATTSDGPAGVRIHRRCGVFTTGFPCATQVACTWDPEIAYAVGEAGAKELKENNMAAWLTPAVNIHRSPLCGRNFEYYSEDPLLAGSIAAGTVRGIQSQGVVACLKHFALNNKETNRKNSDSRVSQRAAREIYLKPFELVVKNTDLCYVMSSYNIINGCRASECKELLTDILRGEWGFDGMVSTDWHVYSEQYKEIKAGNDLRMPGGFPYRMQEAIWRGLITREEIETSVKRILRVILRLE